MTVIEIVGLKSRAITERDDRPKPCHAILRFCLSCLGWISPPKPWRRRQATMQFYLPAVMAATTVAHRTHAARSAEATKVAHRTHAMRSAEAGAVTNTSCSRHLGSVPSANVCGALAVGRRGALAMNRLSILRVRCCLA